MVHALVPQDQARINVTWHGENGDVLAPVDLGATDAQILELVTIAVRTGEVPGIARDATADFAGFKVERFQPTADMPVSRIVVRPPTAYGV